MTKLLIVKKGEPEVFGQEYARNLRQLDGSEQTRMELGGGRKIKVREVPDNQAEDQLREIASRSRHIESVEYDKEATTPEPVEAQAENMTTEAALRLMGVDEVHEMGARGAGKAAIIDTGCGQRSLQRHQARIVYTNSFVQGEGVESPDDTHGEWCLEMMAAIAPDALYMILKGLSGETGSGSYSGIIACIEDAVRQGADVINLSLGGPRSAALNAAVDRAEEQGVIVVVAAGNEQRGKTGYVADETSPASAEKVTTVAAARSDLLVADFSNRGLCLDLSAPGAPVKAPDVAGFWYGTSMATPCVAGVALLLLETNKMSTEVKKALCGTARDTGEPVVKEGYGFVQAAAAYDKLLTRPETPQEQPESEQPQEGLQRMSVSGYCRLRHRDKARAGDTILTVGRQREEFAVVRLRGRFAGMTEDEIEQLSDAEIEED